MPFLHVGRYCWLKKNKKGLFKLERNIVFDQNKYLVSKRLSSLFAKLNLNDKIQLLDKINLSI